MAGRPKLTTPDAIDKLLCFVAAGDSERVACIGAGFSYSLWMKFKREHPEIKERIAEAKAEYARLRHARERATLEEVRLARGSSKKTTKGLKPTWQAQKVMWQLVNRIPLSVKAITPKQLEEACKVINIAPMAFWRQAEVFKLMDKVYAERAKLRGDFGVNREIKAKLFPQTAAYQRPHDWDKPLPDLPSGWTVGC